MIDSMSIGKHYLGGLVMKTTDDSKLASAFLEEKEVYRSLQAMRLHSTMDLDNYKVVMKVHGGWVYYNRTSDWACFVPERG